MNFKKKLSALFLIAVMACGVAACTKHEAPKEPVEDSYTTDRYIPTVEDAKGELLEDQKSPETVATEWAGPEGYTIVVPKGNSELMSVAETLKAWFKAKAEVELKIVTDDKAEAAWELNKKMGTYWTLNASNGITKGTEATQIRKLTLTNGEEEFTVYGKSGETVDLAKLLKVEKAVFTAAAEEVGSIEGMTFTFGTGDDAYTFTTKTMLVADEMVGDYLYKDGVRLNAYQLVEFEDDTYFVYNYHKILKDRIHYIGETYLIGTDYTPGYYYFDAEGKMGPATGVIGDYYYENGVRVKAYTLIETEDGTYYTSDGHRLAKNKAVYLTINGVTGYYWFGEDGKLGGTLVQGDYVYVNGARQKAYKLVNVNGDYYYVYDNHKILKKRKVYVTAAQFKAVGLNLETGYYSFDADGKLMIF